ncbi:MAG TPA: transketolase [Methylomirabilota bacterium]|nr:transketolase [Methylomirabilota bacterium]
MASLPDGLLQSLEDVATRLRIDSIRATTAAGSGHPTSCASAADLAAATFFATMRFDPADPRSPLGDRFVLSKGHAAPLLYAVWAELGIVKRQELTTLRELDSDLEGHPTPRLPFVDVATGSLGQGLGAGLGLALGARMLGSDARVFVLLGDGETAEGSVWEAAEVAGHDRVANLVAIVDVNALGQSGPTMLGHDVRAYQRRFAAFGWRAVTIDGHDFTQIVPALRRARAGRQAPTAIIARTVKGQGIDEVAGKEGWHGKPLPADAAERAIAALESRLHRVPPPPVRKPVRRKLPKLAPQAAPPGGEHGEVATREAYGDALVRLGTADPRVVVLDGDVKNSTYAERFRAAHPERYVEAYIAEQNMVSAAAGLAAQGFVPFASSFACFLTRAADQLRMAGISRSNVKLCGSHAGVSIGEDGPSQMALEDLALFRALPECVVFYPADGVSTDACVQLAGLHRGLVYLRATRMKTPALYRADEAFAVGGLKTVRSSEADALTIVAAGVTLHEALAAHDELAGGGVRVRVIDLYCVKPVDAERLLAAARATHDRVLVVEDHYAEGGLGDAVREALGASGVRVHQLAVREIPHSGPPRKLLERYGIGRGAIVTKVRELLA